MRPQTRAITWSSGTALAPEANHRDPRAQPPQFARTANGCRQNLPRRWVSLSALPMVSEAEQPKVRLGRTGGGSISAAVFAFIERGAILRPQHARELRGSVLLRFSEDYRAVEVDLRGDEIVVADALDADRAHDLVLEGAFHDFAALIAAPLTGGRAPRRRSDRVRGPVAARARTASPDLRAPRQADAARAASVSGRRERVSRLDSSSGTA
jgi:hypothetical protein